MTMRTAMLKQHYLVIFSNSSPAPPPPPKKKIHGLLINPSLDTLILGSSISATNNTCQRYGQTGISGFNYDSVENIVGKRETARYEKSYKKLPTKKNNFGDE